MEEGPSELQFPFEYQELKLEERTEIQKLYKSPYVDFVSVGPKKYKVHRRYKDEAANIYNMPLRNSDIFVSTYQRSGTAFKMIWEFINVYRMYYDRSISHGKNPEIHLNYIRDRTTWTQELVWLLQKDFDYDTAMAIPLWQRYAFLEFFMFYDKQWKEYFRKNISKDESYISKIELVATPVTEKMLSMPSPRLIKTHLPLSLLPPKLLDTAKIVYVARDPRDVAVSSYHHARLFKILEFTGTFKEFWNLFIKDLFTLTPYFEHLKEAWENRNHPNMLFLFYENLLKDLPSAVRRVADFLGKDPTPEDISRLCDHLSFENFKNNDSVNFEKLREGGLLSSGETFIRKGKAGGWRDYFDEEMKQQAERWMADNLRETDLRFPNV